VTVAMRTYVAKGEEAEALKVGAQWFVCWTQQVSGAWAAWPPRWRGMLIRARTSTQLVHHILDSGDHVVVINANQIKMTGNKLEQNVYYSHSSYPGGLKEVPAKRVRETKPEWVGPRSRFSACCPRTLAAGAARGRKLRCCIAMQPGFGAARGAEAPGRRALGLWQHRLPPELPGLARREGSQAKSLCYLVSARGCSFRSFALAGGSSRA